MASFDFHCEESEKLFGDSYSQIHLWLDEFAGKKPFGMRHRRVRHHEAGIQEAIKLFGSDIEKVIRQHIVTDLKEEGWKSTDRFPQNENDYVKMGLF